LIRQRHAKELTYRNIVGKNKNGEIIFIVSNFGGVVTIKDVIDEGLDKGIVEGLLFDGGTSVEYKFDDGNYSTSFIALSDIGKKLIGTDKPTTYIYAN
jgi:exopolysaccharide biosynthesis protein